MMGFYLEKGRPKEGTEKVDFALKAFPRRLKPH